MCASQVGLDWILFAREDLEAIPRQMWGSMFDCASQSVWTVLALLAALSELANVEVHVQAHLVKWRALTPQVLCEGPAPAVRTLWGPVVVRRVMMRVLAGVECMAHLVYVAQSVCTGLVFLQAALQCSKAGMASLTHRSAWPGMCALAGGGSGR